MREHGLGQPVVKEMPVGQPGEAVVVGLPLELFLVAFALDGILHRAQQQFPVDLALDEVILRAALDRGQCQRLVVGAGEDDDGDFGRMRVDLGERLEAQAVGQRQVEQHEGDIAAGKRLETAREAVGVLEPESGGRLLQEHFPDQAGVARVVLDQQDGLQAVDNCHAEVHHLAGGRVTTVSQNRSIDCTTTMNLSRSTGLVM